MCLRMPWAHSHSYDNAKGYPLQLCVRCLFLQKSKNNDDTMSAKTGVYIGLSLALGAGIGTVLGVMFNAVAFGTTFGAGIGLLVGIMLSVFLSGNSKK